MKEGRVTDTYSLKDVQSFPQLIVDSIELNLIERCKRAVSVASARMLLR